jgi:hypothetical protein
MQTALPRVLIRLLAVAALVSICSSARAQTITLQPTGTFYRVQKIRPTGQQPHWISQADCLAKDIISFPITLSGAYLGTTLQVWAGNSGIDCTQVSERTNTGTAECWQVYNAPATISPTTIQISSIDIVARNTPNVVTPIGYPTACNLNGVNSTNSPPNGQQLTLTFMLVTSGTSFVGTPQQWTDIGYDTAPPSEATNVQAGAGETRVHLTWTDAVESDIRSYNFYCDPPPGSVVAPGADAGLTTQGPPLGTLDDVGSGGSLIGTGGDPGLGFGGSLLSSGGTTGFGGSLLGTGGGSLISAGGSFFSNGGAGGTGGDTGSGGLIGVGVSSGGTTQTLASCSSTSALQEGQSPVDPDKPLSQYACGSVTGTIANNGTVSHLINNVSYTFAVAAVDQVGNVGVLSQNTCGTPINVTDFFELYKDAGGRAGGGICSLSFANNPARSGILFVGSMLALAAVTRRARRRRH